MSQTSVKILAIETATPACSVALRTDEGVVERMEVGSNIHSKVLLDMVGSVLEQAKLNIKQLNAIAVGRGPGSFTGLRIGVGVGQGLAYGADCPMIGISSLDALALQATTTGNVIAGIDARMGQIYSCHYLTGKADIERQGELCVSDPAKIKAAAGQTILVGNAWQEYWQQLETQFRDTSKHLSDIVYPSASAILQLAEASFANGDYIAAAEFAPEYVRNDVAAKPRKIKS